MKQTFEFETGGLTISMNHRHLRALDSDGRVFADISGDILTFDDYRNKYGLPLTGAALTSRMKLRARQIITSAMEG